MTGPSAHMASRISASNAPDYFPTPPWATRALCVELLRWHPLCDKTVWEPACGAGHMATPLAEFFRQVFSSDLFDRGFSPHHGGDWDFLCLDPLSQFEPGTFDWIITNPPFGDYPQRFVERALLHRPKKGVAVFVPLRWLETIDRVVSLFLPNPPAIVGIFAERVPLHKGRYVPDGDTATAYCWVIWRTDEEVEAPVIRWIPPGAAKRYFRVDDLLLADTVQPEVSAAPLPLLEAGGA